jgi:pimeloyl-ACP methyl ester carboxylesterase
MQTDFTPSHRGGAGSPMVCIHGFTDTWRTWELVLPALEREHDVLAPTVAGHAGGPPLNGDASDAALVRALERAMDDAGFETAHIVGNSLGGYLALQLAARGRADSVVALAPAGGWTPGGPLEAQISEYFGTAQELLKAAAPHAERIVATAGGRRRATAFTAENFQHIPAELLAHQMVGAASCDAAPLMANGARPDAWTLDAERITCPVRIVWGAEDKILPLPSGAERYRHDWLPNADWIELGGVGHCPQLDVPLEVSELILDFTRG